MARIRSSPVALATLFLHLMLTSSRLHFATAKPTGFSLRLIPRDSPDSPLYPGNLTQLERIERMINFSKARARYLESLSIQNATLNPNRLSVELLRDNYLFYVQVKIGSQDTSANLIMDTGGGLIWTQCEPCKYCYNQSSPIYDSRSSSTYKKVPCNHPICKSDPHTYSCVNDECVYTTQYGDESVTKGVASFESFKFGSTVLNNIFFGCSNDNHVQFSKLGIFSGILGLNLRPDSLAMQLSDASNKQFSYCLVPFSETMAHPSVLRFGKDNPPPSGNIQTTMFPKRPDESFNYYLTLKDVSVGSRRLEFAESTFVLRPDGSGGCFIDSGVIIPQIDQFTHGRNAYKEVTRAFQNYYDSFKLQRTIDKKFELCYKNSPGFNQYATMTYHFDGADYTVDGNYVHYFDTEDGYFCVALKPGNRMTILGAWHQQNKRIIYNGNVGGLQFYTETCANDHLP